jgi:hypothetical protein
MNSLLAFTCIIIICITANSKHNNHNNNQIDCDCYYDTILNRNIYTNVDKYPIYPGGLIEFMKFFRKNFKYPLQNEPQFTINIFIIIDIDGNVISKGIKDKEPEEYTLIDIEGINAINNMPNWEPGKCRNIVVPVKFYIPVRLSLN